MSSQKEALSRVVAELEDLSQKIGAVSALYQKALEREQEDLLLVQQLAVAGALIFFLIASWILHSSIIVRLKGLVGFSRAVAHGQIQSEIPVRGNDEISGLLGSLNEVIFSLKDAHREATEALERIHLLVDNVVDGIITIDERGVIQAYNKAAEKIFGYSAAEAIGQSAGLLMPEPDRSRHDEYIRNYLATGVAKIIGIGRETIGRRKDGTVFPIDLAVSVFPSGRGRAFTGIVRDITERKRAEAEVHAAREAAERANTAKSQFLANMSHELRTPLNSVIGFANLMLKNKPGNLVADDLEYLERIRTNGVHLLTLINEVLDLSKIEAGKMMLEISDVDLVPLVRDTIAQLEGAAHDKNLRLVGEIPSTAFSVRADPTRLKQVLINLVGNAIKFTETGTVTLRLTCDPLDARPTVLEIIDTGVGIRADQQEKIFEAFTQADQGTARKFSGTGLGLTISRSFLQMMGYGLEVESAPGKGSTFRIVFGGVRQAT